MTNFPQSFLDSNYLQSKNLTMAVSIEGIEDIISIGALYTGARYGIGGIYYGQPGLVYGAMQILPNSLSQFLTLEGSLSISQKIEVEQGRSSISQISIVFIDKDGYFTKIFSPGVVVDDLLSGKSIKIFLGYQNTNFPDDFARIFRGYITGVDFLNEKVSVSISDSNYKRRENIFETQKGALVSPLGYPSTSNIELSDYSKINNFYKRVQFYGADSSNISFVNSIRSLIKIIFRIDDEFIEDSDLTELGYYETIDGDLGVQYGSGGFFRTSYLPVGFYQTSGAVSHSSGVEVSQIIELGPFHPVLLSLMIMLSGNDDFFEKDVEIRKIIFDSGSSGPSGYPFAKIYLPEDKDAKEDYGLTRGDIISFNPGVLSDQSIFDIVQDDDGRPNRVIILPLGVWGESPEDPATTTASFRNKYNLLPEISGLDIHPKEIDIDGHENLMNTFLNSSIYSFHGSISEKQNAKEFIESQLLFPYGLYSLTRFGKLSIGMTRPPMSPSKIVLINKDNVVDPTTIRVTRATNNRRFFNQISYSIDYLNDDNDYQNKIITADINSINFFGKKENMLIESVGLRMNLGASVLIDRVSNFLIGRFSKIAFDLFLKTNFGTGVLIEAGDIVEVQDNGFLKIPNFLTGERNIGSKMFEVVERTLNIKDGTTTLKLLSGIQDTLKDRYGSVSPSSKIISSSGRDLVVSFEDIKKWVPSVGQRIMIHPINWNYGDEIVTSIESLDEKKLTIKVSDSIQDVTDYIIDIPYYPDQFPPMDAPDNIDSYYSSIYAYLSSLRYTEYNPPFDGKHATIAYTLRNYIKEGTKIRFAKTDWSFISDEVEILSVTDDIINNYSIIYFDKDIGFDVDDSYFLIALGFNDGNGFYRLI